MNRQIATSLLFVVAIACPPESAARSTASPAGQKPAKPPHWAYVKPIRPALPKVRDADWCRNPIDYFILARLEKAGLKPSPAAPKETLIRRVYLDLIGLPPTPEGV